MGLDEQLDERKVKILKATAGQVEHYVQQWRMDLL